ncbi:sensor histidine kinase [Winogradskyella endarachnes]|uniref:sensor histidine kinase n=1 Tax=Winogradskyella endarachnes TaxID=2681965 RepID=UPI0018D26359|nr:histidine kinase [Winogradskyella endarachnes]
MNKGEEFLSLSIRIIFSILAGGFGMSLAYGVVVYIFPDYNATVMFWVFQFRGLLLNIVILTIIYSFIQFNKARKFELEAERLRSENLGAQLSYLKEQLNPHFFFNSLNILKSMIELKNPQAPELVMKLSEFYRFTLQHQKEDYVLLEKELEIMQLYAYMLNARFEEGLQIKNSIPEMACKVLIPPFTLQILLENCIKHNTITQNEPVIFELYIENEFLVVRNNVIKKRQTIISTQTGLYNIKKRYMLLTNKTIDVIASSDHFTIKLPLIYENTNH